MKYIRELQNGTGRFYYLTLPQRYIEALGIDSYKRKYDSLDEARLTVARYDMALVEAQASKFQLLTSWGKLFTRYQATVHYAELSHNTKLKYAGNIRYLNDFEFQGSLLRDIRVDRFDHAAAYDLKEELLKQKSKSSASALISTLKTVYGFGQRAGLIKSETNPFANLDMKQSKSRETYLTRAEVQDFIDTATIMGMPNFTVFLRILWESAQRPMDILTLRFGDLKNGEWRFTQSKTGTQMLLQLSDVTQREIKNLILMRYDAPTEDIMNDHVIYSDIDGSKHEPLLNRYSYSFRVLRNACGRPDVQIRDFRRSAAVDLSETCSLTEIRAVTGHKKLQSLEHYMPATAAQKQRAKTANQKRWGN